MRISIDLDGTICEIKKENQSYSDVLPKEGAIEKITQLKQEGHYIIIHTSRHMKSCNGDVGKVIARVGKITMDWLTRNKIPFDEIHFGKPNADIYIDDRGYKFEKWSNISLDGYYENSK
ncbi:MAG: HAD hydrolase family protein [Ignavibacteria bacterium]|jgi:capsule biosynthesis phosphatase